MLIDVSQPVTARSAHFPGDEPFSCGWTVDEPRLRVGWIKTSAHVGTHVDAPFHYGGGERRAGAPGEGRRGEGRVGDLDLAAFEGACTIVDARGASEIDARALRGMTLAPRVLFRTQERSDPERFLTRFPVLTQEAVATLARAGVRLVGVDAPSFDPVESKDLPIHHALGRAGIANVENLVLDRAPIGSCGLMAFPIHWRDMDAAPVRAIVRE